MEGMQIQEFYIYFLRPECILLHIGRHISGGKGNAKDKIEKMKSCGILVAESPAQMGKTLYDKLAR